MNYTTYEFYKDTYKGDKIPQGNDFDRVSLRASVEVRKNIFNRDVTRYDNEVQSATCSIADILYEIEELEEKKKIAISDKVVKSESVGDHSKTYDITTVKDIDLQISNLETKIREELFNYLSWTGLLYRGV